MLAAMVALLTTLMAFAGLAFCCVALWAARSFLRDLDRAAPVVGALPPVSILKPLKGLDPSLYEALASHCRQQYRAPYEILFGLSDPADPAVAVIEQLRVAFPDCSLRIVHCPERLGANGKVSNLSQMLPHALYEHILISDGDIAVGPRYLERIMASFGASFGAAYDTAFGASFGTVVPVEPGAQASSPAASIADRSSSHALLRAPVGLVTAPYRGQAHGHQGCARPTLGSRLEALAIATDFFPGVLTARLLERGLHFGLGSTLATTRSALEAVGGLEPLVDHLADDYELGVRLSRAGYRVVLSAEVVSTSVPAYSLRGFWSHQLRWARAVRDSRRAGYVGLALTYAVPWGLLNLVASGVSLASVALLSLVLAVRVTVALTIGVGILGDRQVLRDLWLLPLRDCVGLALWAWSYAEDTVLWRGERLRLRGGLLTREP